MEKSIQMEHVRRTWKFRTVMAEIEHSQGDCQKPDLCICKSMNFYGEGGTCKGILRAQEKTPFSYIN